MKRLILAFALPLMLVLLGCEGSISPTAPDETLVAQQPATSVGVGTTGTSSIVAPGAAREFMLRARGGTSGPLLPPDVPPAPLLGSAWVHVIGQPETASVRVVTTGPPNPDGSIPTSHTFTFGSGDYFETSDLATLDPPFVGPGEYNLNSTLTIVGGSGAFAGMTGTLRVKNGTFTVSGDFMVTTEWHLKGRVQLGD